MLIESIFEIDSTPHFHQKALQWAAQFDEVAYLDSNDYQDQWTKFDCLIAVQARAYFRSESSDTFQELQNFISKHSDTYVPGFLSYDLKNEIETLETSQPNRLAFPQAYFFAPQMWIKIKDNQVWINAEHPEVVYQEIINTALEEQAVIFSGNLQARWTKQEYFKAFQHVQQHIQRGDIYEVNLCQEFFADHAEINPFAVYKKLNSVSPTPFSAFIKFENKYILSASPERFLAKRKKELISQPIKGTAKRGKSQAEDQEIINTLLASKKEIAENVMIVDLVRNDLTKSAAPKSVKADRLFEIHSFKLVHQMISTISCTMQKDKTSIEVIKNTFPAGSMTGAPKIAAMQICDNIELAKRGPYAGSIGYFGPDGDFDFNVVIRSIAYNAENKYLSFQTGGAITLAADVESEYQECLLKADGMLQALGVNLA